MRRVPIPSISLPLSLVLSALMALPRVVLAQPAPKASDEESTQKMREAFEKGQDLYEQRNYPEAARKFREAYDIRPAASLLYNEAVCYEKLKDYGKAANLFKRYLDESKNARDRKDVERRIAALENEVSPKPRNPKAPPGEKQAPTLAEVGESQTRGVFLIESAPPNATVYLDDKNSPPLGETPWNGTIDGKHTVIVVAKGYKDIKREVNGRPNTVNTLFLALSQEHYLGWIEVRATGVAAADVYIDGKESGAVGRTPYMGNITPGKHSITITKEGFTEDSKTVDITAGEATKIEATLDKAPIGFVHIGGSTIEGAVVKLDGKTVCEQAPCRFQSPSGEHRVRIEKKGLKPYDRKMTIVKATETALQVKLNPTVPRTDLIWKFGFAAAFITGGIVLGLQANSVHDAIKSDIDKGLPPAPPNDSRYTKGKIFAYAADGCYLVGGITAIVAVISIFGEKGPPSTGVAESRDLADAMPSGPFDLKPSFLRGNARISPAVGPNYAGVAAEVRW
jgi:PEGA domain-containing protein/tetratricopeptide repeat protein